MYKTVFERITSQFSVHWKSVGSRLSIIFSDFPSHSYTFAEEFERSLVTDDLLQLSDGAKFYIG